MKKKTATTRYDVAAHLRTPEEMAAYQVARDAGLSRESLYKALSGERSPDFDTVLKVMGALGLRLRAEAAHG
jgi:DNA-binding phage protein